MFNVFSVKHVYRQTCRFCLTLTVQDLKALFADDPSKMSVGMKSDMVEELVKMLYFDYTIDIEV